jgi:hypothetical protein
LCSKIFFYDLFQINKIDEIKGCAFPASHGIVANWCPPSERGRMGGFIYTGRIFLLNKRIDFCLLFCRFFIRIFGPSCYER